MPTTIGMNGFGRIGRQLTRLIMDDPDLKLGVVNARRDNATYAHLFKYDSVHGMYDGEVQHNDQGLVIDGEQTVVTRWNSPEESKWGEMGCDLVIEATGKFTKRDECQKHLDAGAKKVVISANGKNEDITVVMNVNHQDYDPAKHDVISSGSCTTNCLAPAAKLLNDRFSIKHGLMTTIHSYTMSQRILDGSHKDLRRARAAAMSQIPTTTGAAKAVTRVLPELENRMDGMAVRVPTPSGSLVDLVCELEKKVTVEAINTMYREAANETLGYTDEPLVSVDFIGDSHAGVVDGLSTMVMGDTMAKVIIWYDNEAGYTHQLYRLVKLVAGSL